MDIPDDILKIGQSVSLRPYNTQETDDIVIVGVLSPYVGQYARQDLKGQWVYIVESTIIEEYIAVGHDQLMEMMIK